MKRNPLDQQIEREYHARAQGKEINIMDIPKLFTYARERAAAGVDVGVAVQEAVDQLCRATGGVR
jgi:hypothetical protein